MSFIVLTLTASAPTYTHKAAVIIPESSDGPCTEEHGFSVYSSLCPPARQWGWLVGVQRHRSSFVVDDDDGDDDLSTLAHSPIPRVALAGAGVTWTRPRLVSIGHHTPPCPIQGWLERLSSSPAPP